MKVMVEYDSESGEIKDSSGFCLINCGPGLGVNGFQTKPESLDVKEIVQLKEAGFDAKEIIELHNSGAI